MEGALRVSRLALERLDEKSSLAVHGVCGSAQFDEVGEFAGESNLRHDPRTLGRFAQPRRSVIYPAVGVAGDDEPGRMSNPSHRATAGTSSFANSRANPDVPAGILLEAKWRATAEIDTAQKAATPHSSGARARRMPVGGTDHSWQLNRRAKG
jgi:hypothetical protein